MHALVLLGDVVRSRDVEDRTAFQGSFDRAIVTVNERHEDDLIARATVLKGIDEVGMVLESLAPVYDIVRRLLDGIRPHVVRFALVFDEVDVGTESESVAQMDGPAFHRADELLDQAERDHLWFDMRVGMETLERAVADEVNLLLRLRHEMTDREFEAVRTYERYGTQAAAAEEVGVTQQAVSESLRRSGWRMGRTVERRLDRTLAEVEP